MSSNYHRPTHSMEEPWPGLTVFNATQVRLYGIYKFFHFGPFAQFTVSPRKVAFADGGVEAPAANREKPVDRKEESAERKSKPEGLVGFSGMVIDIKDAGSMALIASPAAQRGEPKKLSMGVIYSYAYEGHCYDLAKPKVMLIPADPEEPTCDDCGYDDKFGCDYMVWVVDKLDRCVEIEVNQGFVEQLVLEANLPGKRSPSTYRATASMAHRSGRLTE